MPAIVFARRTASVGRVHVNEGEAWAGDDPIVVANPDLFSQRPTKVRRSVPAPVEQATAAPGERRHRG